MENYLRNFQFLTEADIEALLAVRSLRVLHKGDYLIKAGRISTEVAFVRQGLKGFIDRLFLPGMAFKYRENSVWWDKLLAAKTAHIITTLDQPFWYYQWVFGNPSIDQLKRSTLEFCGVKPVKVTYVGPIRNSEETFRKNWINKVQRLGAKLM